MGASKTSLVDLYVKGNAGLMLSLYAIAKCPTNEVDIFMSSLYKFSTSLIRND
jgi:hypothetical protein